MNEFNCEVCRTVRPSEKIEVFVACYSFKFGGSVNRNVRYCMDNPTCKTGAEKIAQDFGDSLGDEIIKLNFCPAGFGDVVEGPLTEKAIAAELKATNVCIVGWNDQQATHHDVLFTLKPRHFGNLMGGLRAEEYLFVSIMRIGAFGFSVYREKPLDPDYVNEKLGGLGDLVKQRLTNLINGVIDELQKI
jgi:hypothetical protein